MNDIIVNYIILFAIAYCYLYEDHLKEEWKTICQTFISSVKLHYPELLKKTPYSSLSGLHGPVWSYVCL